MARGREVDKGVAELVLGMKKLNQSLTTAQIGTMLGMDATTAGRIISCGSWEGYCAWKADKAARERDKSRRKATAEYFYREEREAKDREKNRKAAEMNALEQLEEEEVPGQIRMDLDAEEQPEQKQVNVDQVKMMRFWAAQFDDTNEVLQAGMERIAMALDKLNDTMMQLIRCIRKE